MTRVETCERCGAPVTHGTDCAPDCSASLCWPCLRDELERDRPWPALRDQLEGDT